MKNALVKIQFIISAFFFVFCTDLFCEEFNKTVTKEFEVNAQILKRDVKLYSITYYNTEGLPVHIKYNTGDEWFAYDTRGNCIWSKSNTKGYFEEWMEYDQDNHLIYRKEAAEVDDLIEETWYEYDYYGNVTSEKIKRYNLKGKFDCEIECSYENTYDDFGNLIRVEDDRGYVTLYEYEYDEDGNLLSKTENGSSHVTYEYDRRGNVVKKIYHYDEGDEYVYVYEDDRFLVYEKWPRDGEEVFYEYEFDVYHYPLIKVKKEYLTW